MQPIPMELSTGAAVTPAHTHDVVVALDRKISLKVLDELKRGFMIGNLVSLDLSGTSFYTP